jgi:acetyl-CoA C-acetyltransferase
VSAGHASRVEAVAECCAHAAYLVGGELLALPGASEDDPKIDIAIANGTPGSSAERRVIDPIEGMGAVIDDLMPPGLQDTDEARLQLISSVIGADCDAHDAPVYEPPGEGHTLGRRMAIDPHLPVIIGVGQVTHRAATLAEGLEPLDLMVAAVIQAADDAGLDAVPAAEAIRVVSLLSWRYRDPARFVAERLGLDPRETGYSTNGGNSPQSLMNITAAEIQRGDLDLAILTGAEAWRTRGRARKEGAELPWTIPADDLQPTRILGEELQMNHPAELERGVMMPVQVYPLFESALRAAAGETVEEHQVKISELWARFSDVAAANPYAWIQSAKTAEEIRTTGPANRMIGFPYPKYMNSNNDVDQAAALIVCSVAKARELGVPEDRWVFVHSGSDCHEHAFISERWTYSQTPAVELGGRRALELAGMTIDDIDLVDLYSCFPAAVQLGAQSLGLDLERQLTRTGGLSFAGGPWNNYVMHAIATMVGDLRSNPGANGLVWANGGYATKHAFGVYSTRPPAEGFRHAYPQAEIDAMPRRTLASPAEAAGPATIEAYSVMHDRDGHPEMSIAACLLADGRRAWGISVDRAIAASMCEGEWVGRSATLDDAGTLLID